MFEPNKNATELGIDITRKFRVVEDSCYFKKGEVITLKKDDDTLNPYFWKEDKSNYCPIHWSSLEYADKDLDNLEVGDVLVDTSGNEITVLGVLGQLIFLSKYSTQEYYSGGYTVIQLKDYGFKLKCQEEEITELTIDQIAEKFGKDPSKIKIKK